MQLFPAEAQGCSHTVKTGLAEAIRSGIESEVLRGEEALRPPQPIAALGCLDNLMSLNLDIAIQVPNLAGLFQSAVSQAENQICSFAQDKLNELTAQISSLLQLPSFDFLPIGGLSGGSTTAIGGVDLNTGGGRVGGGLTINGSTVTENNLDAVYRYIYGAPNDAQ
ncbi:hypothetical protein [Nitratireductor sp. XY-223]|uniref:hypothetical protein n=1 Tax=Nitratireductor sp. XY-223 TaxID=2561926 RepID=UPI0010A9B41C|nr:hypothetical protein [Nitratireductor sp. XY-223]